MSILWSAIRIAHIYKEPCHGILWLACSSSSSFEPVVTMHCLAALEHGASVKQPCNYLIIQNHQAVQSMGRLMDWTLEDDMVSGLFFCATLKGHTRNHNQFVEAEAETSKTDAKAVKSVPRCSWKGDPGGWVPVSGMKVRSVVVLSNHSAFNQLSVRSDTPLLFLSDELMSCCAADTNGYLDLRRREFPFGGQVSAECTR